MNCRVSPLLSVALNGFLERRHSHHPTKEDMENYREMKERLERLKRPPQQKSTLPVTESQEYGWSWEDARRDDMLDRRLPKESCDETKVRSKGLWYVLLVFSCLPFPIPRSRVGLVSPLLAVRVAVL